MSENLLSSLDGLSETIFGSAHCTVMHSDAIVLLFFKMIANWSNFCKRQTGSFNFFQHEKTIGTVFCCHLSIKLHKVK